GSIPLVSTRGNGPSGTARTRPLVQLGVQLEKRLGGPAPLLLGEEVSGSPRRAPSSVAARSTTDGPGTPAPDSHSIRRRSAGNSATSSGPARFATSSPVPHTRACDSPVGTGAHPPTRPMISGSPARVRPTRPGNRNRSPGRPG